MFLSVLAGNLTTTMGIGFLPITLMSLVLVYEISKIDFRNLKKNNFLISFKIKNSISLNIIIINIIN